MKDYVKLKVKRRHMWAKCDLKDKFAGGVSTTSRIEGLHAIQKNYFTSSSSLQSVFRCFGLIENFQEIKCKEEFERHKKVVSVEKITLFEDLKTIFSEYIMKKITPKFYKALNYTKEEVGRNKWYFNLILMIMF